MRTSVNSAATFYVRACCTYDTLVDMVAALLYAHLPLESHLIGNVSPVAAFQSSLAVFIMRTDILDKSSRGGGGGGF